ncbi:MAG: metal ABC transporter substrate-binding protein [Pseudomonadota bacterium]
MIIRRTLLASISALAAIGLTCGMATAADDKKLAVVATFSILGDMVGSIGGDHIKLTTLVGPNGDAHVYQPVPADARAVSEADLLVVNGLAFEGWLDRLVDASGFSGMRLVATDGIEPLPFEEEGDHDDEKHGDDHADHKDDDHAGHKDDDHAEHKDDDHGHKDDDHAEHKDDDHAGHKDDDHHGHDHGAFDPHAWQSIEAAMVYIDNITAALSKADPAHASSYYQNRAAYVAELTALETELRTMFDALPEDARTVVTPHDAFGYFADAYGLKFLAPQGISTESEASAADVAKLIRQIRAEGIKGVFVENVADSRLLEQIANETGAVIGGSLYSDALSESDGPASTYLDMMRHNARTLAQALSS